MSPPGLHTRGSGFFDFSFTTLTAGNLLVAILFFSAPSKALRILFGCVSALLIVDLILIVSVARIRDEESWPGIASIIWAVVMSIWCIVTDRIVAWGKREEEERLTGRPETRRTLAEWTAVLIATVLLVVYLAIVIFMTATLSIRANDATLKFDGDRVFVDGHKYQVHVACVGDPWFENGKKLPTMLVESGEAPSEYDFEHWAYASYQNGTIGRYCYWDRPGYAWSDNAPSPHSAGMSADVLSESLAKLGEQGPWILASAGYGSIVSRIFASRHPRDIAGLLLVDPLHEDLLHRIASPAHGFNTWAHGIISPLGIRRVLGALFNGRTRQDRVFGRSAHLSGKYIKAQLQESLVANSLSRSEVVSARTIQSPDTPLAVISSGISVRRDEEWGRKQRDLSRLTDRLIAWDVVNQAPHEVWRTYDGRHAMERRLGELVSAYKKSV